MLATLSKFAMLLENRIATIIETFARMQQLVLESPAATTLDKAKAHGLMVEFRKNLNLLFKLDPVEEPAKLQTSYTSEEITGKVTSVAYETKRIFGIFDLLPTTKAMKVDFIRRRSDALRVQNLFTKKMGHIQAEFGKDDDIAYVIQYDDGTYNITVDENLAVI